MPAGARYVAVLRPASLLAAAIAACAFVLLGFTVPVQATAPAPVAVGSNPRSVAISPDGSFAYVSALDAGTVSRVDTATNTVTASITTGGRPWFVAFAPSGAFAYVTDFGRGTVMRLRASDDTVVNTIPVGQNPRSVSFSPDGVFAYVAGEDGFVRRIQTSNDTVTATIAVGGLVTSIDISPSGSYAYVANFGLAAVQRIDTNSDRVVATVSLPVPYFVDIAPSGDFAYVSNHYAKTVTRLRTSDNAIAATTAVGDTPLGLRISPDSSCAFVSVYADNVVKRIRTDSDVVAGTIPLAGPYGVAIATDMHSAFVSSISTNTLSKISAPDAPALTQATPGDGTTQIHFVPGADNNYPITNYEYSIDDGDHWTTPNPASTTSPITITGLTNGTTYTVRLRALNSAGTGTPSSPITVTPRRLPGAPTNLAAEVGDRQAVVAFTAAALDGVKPLTNYEYSTNDGATWTALSPASTTSPITITGLTNGTTYPIRLRAINADGSGTSSDAISVTPRTTPTEPTLTSADAGDSQTTLRFSPPVSDGGAPITNYAYSIDDGAHWTTPNPASTTSPITITGLTNGTTYTVRLRALNSAGASPASNNLTVTPLTVPSAPTLLSVQPGQRQATVEFAAPAVDGGSPITNYQYSIDDGDSWTARQPASTATTFTIGDMINGTTYRVKIRAANVIGHGPASNAIAVLPRTQSTPPQQVSVVPGDKQVRVSWSPPADAGGLPISAYVATAQPGGNVCSTAGTTSCVISGLSNGGWYRVAVTAVTDFGVSAPSALSALVIPRSVPGAPISVLARAGFEEVTVNWGVASSSGGRPILGYRVTSIDGSLTCSPGPSARSCVFRKVPGDRSYRFLVQARNEAGYSTPRISTIVKTKFLPRPPVLAGWPSTFMVVLNTMTGFNANYWTPRGTRITRVELQALQDGRVVAQGPTVGLPPGSYRLSQRVWFVMSNGQAGVAGWSQLIRINSYNPVPQVGVGTPNNFVLTAKGPLLTLVSRTESGGLRRIVGRITTDGAREFCFRDPGNEVGSGRLSFDGCVTEVLQGTRFGNLAGRDFVAFAQCPTGRISPATLFQNALNGWWQSAGRPGYWTNMENGRQINPSNASGGGVLLGQFNLACV